MPRNEKFCVKFPKPRANLRFPRTEFSADVVWWPADDLSLLPSDERVQNRACSAEIQRVCDSILADGLAAPLEICPRGMVLSGWYDLVALQSLGWEMIPVIVRSEFAGTSMLRDDHGESDFVEIDY